MGFRRHAFLLSATFALLMLAACGDNKHPVFDDAGIDTMGITPDAVDAPPDAGCVSGKLLCGTTCVDPKTDDKHCGDCSTDCTVSGGTCQTSGSSTMCCGSGLTNCSGVCVDLTSNVDNCGTCGTDCGTGTCQTDGTSHICCPANQINCGGQCFDPKSSEANCGGCAGTGSGTACNPSSALNTCCNGTCVDVTQDAMNCSACSSMPNEGGMNCTGGTPDCDPPVAGSTGGTASTCCPTGQVNCSGTCIVPGTISDTNCGGCGAACDTANNKHCQSPDSGTTPACCLNTENNCNGTCSNPLTDNNNCGSCGNACTGTDTCKSGVCCGPGEVNCGGVCVDPKTDPAHCGVNGTCTGGSVCTTGSGTPVCSDGSCQTTCDSGETACPVGATGTSVCTILTEDPNHCGTCSTVCAPDQVCSGGSCVASCGGTLTNCNGACVDLNADPNHCGSCSGATAVCPAPTDVCSMGTCCPAGQVVNGVDTNNQPLCCQAGWLNCNGVCKDPLDPATCGTCNMNCGTGTCTTGSNGTFCCPLLQSRCGTMCVDKTTDEMNCGTCGTVCTSPDQCGQSSPTGSPACCDPSLENNCSGVCHPKNEDTNCGACGNDCTTNGQHCDQGSCCMSGYTNYVVGANHKCCPAGQVSCDGTTCIDLNAATTCGTTCANKQNCTTHTDGTTLCLGGVCSLSCPAGTPTNCFGSCVNTLTDPDNCGQMGGMSTANACGNSCAIGATCSGGACQPCPTGPAAGCSGQCVNTLNDPLNCGACGTTCSGGTPVCTPGVTKGHCCPTGQSWCGSDATGSCVDVTSDEANCGGCAGSPGAEVCGTGQNCTNGDCSCGFNQTLCGSTCVTESVDPSHCGSCTNVCGTGVNAGKPYCVSNSCVATCPAPLTACGSGASAVCTNTKSDSDNCGGCGAAFKCPNNTLLTGKGCVDGACVTKFPVGADPAKCVGGGPPLIVPGGPGGGNVCTGELGQVSFTFGLCSRTNVGPLSAAMFQDAFNSTTGAYKNTCTSDADCGTGGKCVGDPAVSPPNPWARTCVGGGVGINGTVSPIADTTKSFHVGGDFWAFGTIGLAQKGDVTVKKVTYVKDGFDMSGNDRFFGVGTATTYGQHIRGLHEGGATDTQVFSVNGAGNVRMDSTLFTEATTCNATTGPLAASKLQINASPKCTPQVFDQALRDPCGSAADLIPVRNIVEYFRNPAHNDNQAIGLKYDAVVTATGDIRLELPCGYYYLDSLSGSNKITIVVKGRTALFIGGAADIHVEMTFDVQPNASLDMFVGGVVNIAHVITLGSPAYPRLTRMYIGSANVAGDGSACTNVSQCGGGKCSTCPAPNASFVGYAPCTGAVGTCSGGGSNLSQAINMSQGGNFNGLLWAGYGSFSSSNNVEMYGSIFANYLDFSGALTVHYDNGVSTTQQECGTPITGGACESCRDCGNQACINNVCSATCTSDSQCCPPYHCDSGGTNKCVP